MMEFIEGTPEEYRATKGGYNNKGLMEREPRFNPSEAAAKQVGGNHYSNMAITPTHYILANNIGWLEGNVIKYISRYKSKNGKEDLDKAIHYIELIKARYND